jgi:UDP-N-acetyl-D-glucosamine dehydrogenase
MTISYLNKKLDNNSRRGPLKISIIGMGYVGLPMAIRFSEIGDHVIGFDLDQSKITALKKSNSYLSHIPSKKISDLNMLDFHPSSEPKSMKGSDVFIICVPTPLNKYKEPDMKYIRSAINIVSNYLQKNQIICLVSTTYPGTTEEIIIPKLIEKKFIPGVNIHVIYSPEREDPGNQTYNFKSTPRILGGFSAKCLKAGQFLFNNAVDNLITVSDLKTAEMVKLLENIYRSVNIGLVNEIKKITHKMDIDVFEVINAAQSKPFGFQAFFPGPGLGGHCIPIDPFYLSWKAKEYDLTNHFIELAGEINTQMPYWVIERASEALNSKGKSISNSKILVLGASYKKNINDVRESPSLKILSLLHEKKAKLAYSDPFVPSLIIENKVMKNIKITKKNLSAQDLIIIVTDHDQFDFNLIKNNSNLILDTRGVYKKLTKKIFRA